MGTLQSTARALALYGEQTAASHFMEDVAAMRVYLTDPEKAAMMLRAKFEDRIRQHPPATETKVQGTEEAESSSSSETITFELSPDAIAEDRARPFPPNP